MYQTVPTLDEDEVWKWNSLSEIVNTINKSLYWQAELLTTDGPAVRLCRQTSVVRQMPYECVVSEVGLFGLTEPSLASIAATPSGGLAYQVREFLQAIAERGEAMVIAAAMTCLCRRHVFLSRNLQHQTRTARSALGASRREVKHLARGRRPPAARRLWHQGNPGGAELPAGEDSGFRAAPR